MVPVLVLVVASTQRPNPPKLGLDMETNLLAFAARSRADRTRRAPPPTRGSIRDFGQRLPPGAMGPHHTPTLAHNALKPQAIPRRRAFKKATHRFAPSAVRKRTCLPRARSRTTTRDKHYYMALVGSVMGFRPTMSHRRRRGASLHLATHHVHGHPATRWPTPPPSCHVPSAGVPLAHGDTCHYAGYPPFCG